MQKNVGRINNLLRMWSINGTIAGDSKIWWEVVVVVKESWLIEDRR